MVKKGLHIVLVATLLISTAGLTLSKHYCGGNLRSVSIMTVPEPCCDTEGCCHTDTVVFRVNDDFTMSALNVEFGIDLPLDKPLISFASEYQAQAHTVKLLNRDIHSPPGVRDILTDIQSFIL